MQSGIQTWYIRSYTILWTVLMEGEHGPIHLPVQTFPVLELARNQKSKGRQGRDPDTQFRVLVWVRHAGCHPRLNKVSGKTAVDLTGPEFLSHYISLMPPSSWNDCAAAEASPRTPGAAILHSSLSPVSCISCVWILGGVRSMTLWGAAYLSALPFLSLFFFKKKPHSLLAMFLQKREYSKFYPWSKISWIS